MNLIPLIIALLFIAGCSGVEPPIVVPLMVAQNSCVVYDVAPSVFSRACWVSCYDTKGNYTGDKPCTTSPAASTITTAATTAAGVAAGPLTAGVLK